MRCFALLAAQTLAAALAMAAEPAADLRQEIERLKQQVAALSRGELGRGPRIGAVNIVRVFDELEEKIDMNAELRQLEEKRTTKLRELSDRVRDLEDKGKLLQADSAEAKENRQLLETASREFRSYRDATEDHLYNKLYDFTLGIYRKIRDEVQAYAREAGYDVVLRTREVDIAVPDQDLRPRTRYMELNRRIDSQTVLFHGPALDFTDAIIKRLNEKYQRTRAEKEKHRPPTESDRGDSEHRPGTPPAK